MITSDTGIDNLFNFEVIKQRRGTKRVITPRSDATIYNILRCKGYTTVSEVVAAFENGAILPIRNLGHIKRLRLITLIEGKGITIAPTDVFLYIQKEARKHVDAKHARMIDDAIRRAKWNIYEDKQALEKEQRIQRFERAFGMTRDEFTELYKAGTYRATNVSGDVFDLAGRFAILLDIYKFTWTDPVTGEQFIR